MEFNLPELFFWHWAPVISILNASGFGDPYDSQS